jgi:PAS domain-containing protein
MLRDAILDAGHEAVVILGADLSVPLTFGAGSTLLQDCLAGPDAADMAKSLDYLLNDGVAFERVAHTPAAETIAVRGKPVGRRAVLFLTPTGIETDTDDGTTNEQTIGRLELEVDAARALLDTLTAGIAVFGPDRRLLHYNTACAKYFGLPLQWLNAGPLADDLFDRLRELRRIPEQRDFHAWKRNYLDIFKSADRHDHQLWHLAGGPSLRVTVQPHRLGGVAVIVEDISDMLNLQGSYKSLMRMQKATLDTIDDAMAIFGPNGRLQVCNLAFQAQWRLSDADIFVEPHVNRLADISATRLGPDEVWSTVTSGIASHEPQRLGGMVARADGRVLSIALERLPGGSTLATFSDDTDRLTLEDALRERPAA